MAMAQDGRPPCDSVAIDKSKTRNWTTTKSAGRAGTERLFRGAVRRTGHAHESRARATFSWPGANETTRRRRPPRHATPVPGVDAAAPSTGGVSRLQKFRVGRPPTPQTFSDTCPADDADHKTHLRRRRRRSAKKNGDPKLLPQPSPPHNQCGFSAAT